MHIVKGAAAQFLFYLLQDLGELSVAVEAAGAGVPVGEINGRCHPLKLGAQIQDFGYTAELAALTADLGP